MKNEVEVSDLKNIIQDLISFIVVEGKEFVDEKKQKAYTMKYVQCFIKAINEAPLENRKTKISKIINDISKDVKNVN